MSTIGLMQQGRLPFIRFEQRAIKDGPASEKAGHLVMKDLDFVIVHPAGSKDTFEKPAEEWLADTEQQVQTGRVPPEHQARYKTMFQAYKDGREIPPDGYSVRQWAGISKAEAENLVQARVMTVEDLAAANEQTINKIGMGGRALQHKARAFLDTIKGNVNPEELAALRSRVTEQDGQIKELMDSVRALTAQVEAQGSKRKTA